MSRIAIDIADDLLLALREHPQEVAHEMRVISAIPYFQSRRLSLGQAARLAGMPRLEFMDGLNTRVVPNISVLRIKQMMAKEDPKDDGPGNNCIKEALDRAVAATFASPA